MPIYSNTEQCTAQHGGNVAHIEALYPHAPRPWIDLSTGINPYAYPLLAIAADWLCRLTDRAELDKALKASAHYFGCGVENISLAPGMQPLLLALSCLRLKEYGVAQVRILAPTYTEHKRVWENAGHHVSHHDSVSDLAAADVAIICTPNNPDGRSIARPQLQALAEALQEHKGWLIIDSAFDIHLENSLFSTQPNVITLHSFGKFFGIAGLRVSAAIASDTCNSWLRTMLGSWPISTPACLLLPDMLKNTRWITSMRVQLEKEAYHWRSVLAQNFTLIGHTSLFTLVETADAKYWHDHFAAQGIVVRPFDYNHQWLRFGLPHTMHMERIQRAFLMRQAA